LAFAEEFLAALCDPEGGEALYRMHASDAAVRDAGAIRRAADVDCGRFSRSHREISIRGLGILPTLSCPTLLQAPANGSDTESVAWFEVTETREQRQLIAALGLRTRAGERRVGWCTLASRVESWSYADGLLQNVLHDGVPEGFRALFGTSEFGQWMLAA
jgi:hypothetical protein